MSHTPTCRTMLTLIHPTSWLSYTKPRPPLHPFHHAFSATRKTIKQPIQQLSSFLQASIPHVLSPATLLPLAFLPSLFCHTHTTLHLHTRPFLLAPVEAFPTCTSNTSHQFPSSISRPPSHHDVPSICRKKRKKRTTHWMTRGDSTISSIKGAKKRSRKGTKKTLRKPCKSGHETKADSSVFPSPIRDRPNSISAHPSAISVRPQPILVHPQPFHPSPLGLGFSFFFPCLTMLLS